jgi:hypothetical protein
MNRTSWTKALYLRPRSIRLLTGGYPPPATPGTNGSYRFQKKFEHEICTIYCGAWLSILSGWRRDRVTHVDLQMNDSRFKKESLSAVMRAFMLEHEIACKQQLIDFVGGTSLLLRRYCRPIEPCTDIFLWQPCLRAILSKIVLPLLKRDSTYERVKQTTAQSESLYQRVKPNDQSSDHS